MPSAPLSKAIPFFPYPQVYLSEQDDLERIFRDVGRRGAFIMQRDLLQFEAHLAAFLAVRHAVGVANATDGLLIALRAAGIKAGDEVLFCSHTMVATAAAIHFAGAIPVPIDCGDDHLMNPVAAADAITPRTRAILPTQLNGRTADMDALVHLAQRHELVIVEDAAQALGSKWNSRAAGTFGAAGVISFFPAKLLGCLGDGGAVVCNSEQIAGAVKALHDHGRDASGEVRGWGFNSRLDNLQAAILDWRLGRYGDAVNTRRQIARQYQQELQGISEMILPPGPDENTRHFDVYQNYEVEAEDRDRLSEYLTDHGIGTSLPWGGRAVHQWPDLDFRVSLPRVEQLFRKVLLLPMHAWLSEQEVSAVCDAIRQFYRGRPNAPQKAVSQKTISPKTSLRANAAPSSEPESVKP